MDLNVHVIIKSLRRLRVLCHPLLQLRLIGVPLCLRCTWPLLLWMDRLVLPTKTDDALLLRTNSILVRLVSGMIWNVALNVQVVPLMNGLRQLINLEDSVASPMQLTYSQ